MTDGDNEPCVKEFRLKVNQRVVPDPNVAMCNACRQAARLPTVLATGGAT
jgi:hypothetical protein